MSNKYKFVKGVSVQYTTIQFILIEMVFLMISLLKYKNLKRYLFFMLIVAYSFFIGYRNENIGIDTLAYIREYLTGTGGYFSEKGFTTVGKYLYNLGFSSQNYFTFLSFLALSVYYLGFKNISKKNENYFLVCWIFFFNISGLYGNVNGLRQFIAGSFLLLSIGFFRKNKNILSYIFFFMGILFHKSMIIFIFLYFKIFFKMFKNMTKNQKISIIIIGVLSSFLLKDILLLNNQIFDYAIKSSSKIFYVKYMCLLIIYLFYQEEENKELFKEYIFFSIFLIINIFINFEHLANRFLYYINIFTPILFYQMFDKNNKIINKKSLILLVTIYHILILFYPSTKIMFNFL